MTIKKPLKVFLDVNVKTQFYIVFNITLSP